MAAGPSFRLLGIPVRIEPTFFVIAALLGFTGDLTFLVIWVAVVTISVLLHELGHGVAFRAFGKQPEILLQGMGGLTSAPGTLTPGRDLVVSLAGPLTGLVLIGLPALWLQGRVPASADEWDTALRILVFVNIAWSVINLLPVLPLDGGRVAASVLHLVTGRPAEKPAHVVSVVVAGAAGLWAFAEGQVFMAMFAGFFLAFNLSQLSHLRAQGRNNELLDGYRALLHGDADQAIALAQAQAAAARKPAAMAAAVELEAWAQLRQGRPDEAETTLRRLPGRVAPNKLLTGCVKLAGGGPVEALADLADAFASREFGPWNPIAADLVAGAGALDPLVDRLVATHEKAIPALLQLQSDLHHVGRYDESASVGERAFPVALATGTAANPASFAYNVACSLARVGRTDEGLTWLERAVANGFGDRNLIHNDPDLAPLRTMPGFEALRSRLP